jgi:hypothetical protein
MSATTGFKQRSIYSKNHFYVAISIGITALRKIPKDWGSMGENLQ